MTTPRRLHWTLVLSALLLAAAWGALAVTPSYQEVLDEADDLRSVSAEAFDEKLAELTRRSGEATPRQLEHLHYLKAYRLAYSGRYDMAIDQAAALFESSGDAALKFRAGLLMANSYAATREFSSGLSILESTLELLPSIQDHQLRHDGMTVAALLYNQVGEHELGLQFAEDVLADDPSERSRCFAGYLRLEAMRELQIFSDPPSSVQALIDGCASQNERLATGLARGQLSRIMAENGDLDGAIALIQEHLPEITATRYPRLVSEIQWILSQHLIERGDLDGAARHARLAIEAGSDAEYSLPVVGAHYVLYQAALSQGRPAEALEHFRNYAAADKAYLNDFRARQMAYQMVRHEISRKTQEIALLNRRNEVLALEQKVAAQATRNTQLVVALLAVLLGAIGFWAWRTKRAQVKFRRLAETDALTGVANRMDFNRRSEEALVYCRRENEEVALVMFDLDEFKAINDRFGHPVGDWVLKEVARVCTEVCRKNDRFGRLGGEEFAFLLVGCDLPSAVALAQACRKRIAAIDTKAAGHVFTITASFGVAGTRACGYDFLTLLSRADDALYQAKHGGRDRVCTHGLESKSARVPAT